MKVGDIFYLPEEKVRARGFDAKYSPYFHPLKDFVKIEINVIKPAGQSSYAKILYDKKEGLSYSEDIFVWFEERELLTKEEVLKIKKQQLEKALLDVD